MSKTAEIHMSKHTDFEMGDTVVTGQDVLITTNDKSIVIPKGTKALVHITINDGLFWEPEHENDIPTIRLYFGFKNPHWDSWAMRWKPAITRKVLIEKTIKIFEYDTDEKFLNALFMLKEQQESAQIPKGFYAPTTPTSHLEQ